MWHYYMRAYEHATCFLHVYCFHDKLQYYNKTLASDPALLTCGVITCFYISAAQNLTLTLTHDLCLSPAPAAREDTSSILILTGTAPLKIL